MKVERNTVTKVSTTIGTQNLIRFKLPLKEPCQMISKDRYRNNSATTLTFWNVSNMLRNPELFISFRASVHDGFTPGRS